MTDYREILRLAALGLTRVSIGEALGYSRNTVGEVLRRAKLKELSCCNSLKMVRFKTSIMIMIS